MKSQNSLRMWLKYKPEFARTVDGTVTLPKYFLPGQSGKKAGHYRRMVRHIELRQSEGKLWMARIYEQPGNRLVYAWTERDGELIQSTHQS